MVLPAQKEEKTKWIIIKPFEKPVISVKVIKMKQI